MTLFFKFNQLKHKSIVRFFSYKLLFVSILLMNVAQATNITVNTSRNPVDLDSTFHLTYEADSNVDSDPDFSPIYNDFDVLSSSQSTNMRSINGNWSLKKTWQLTLFAKDIGLFTIPAINFGKDIAPAIKLTVIGAAAANKPPGQSPPNTQATIPAQIFLEGAVDKKTGWIHAQFIYTVRLLRTVSITGASLSEPQTSDADAIIHRISEDQYQTSRQGIQYEVIERRYAIFPQKSGVLTINPVTFEGRINATQPRTIFDQFQLSGQLKRLRNKAIKITVKAAPETINLQDWLPASKIQLIDEWSEDIQNITAGEPVTRTILIAAEGLTSVQLPSLEFADIDGLKQYPDKAIIEDKQSSTGITGYKQLKIALIPARAGTYILPEISLPWWNTKTNKKEITSLPETVITVHADVNASTDSGIPLSQTTNQIPLQAPLNQTTPTDNKTVQAVAIAPGEATYWKWLTAFFACLWLATLILLFKKVNISNTASNTKSKKNSNNKSRQLIAQSRKAVEKYAGKNAAEQTKTALIKWAQLNYENNKLNNLSQISQHCSNPLSQQIRQLNQALYSPEKPEWHGEELLEIFKNEPALINQQRDNPNSALKPLYTSRT